MAAVAAKRNQLYRIMTLRLYERIKMENLRAT